MDFKNHTKERFKERFGVELSDTEYLKICDICRSNDIYIKRYGSNNSLKVVIKYENQYIWCVISHKRKIVKTVYPVKKRIINKLIN